MAQLQIPNETTWLIAKSNHIPYLSWSDNLDGIQHFEFQNSSIRKITDGFFSNIKVKETYLNLANNNLKCFPKTLNRTSFSEVYLAGSPIDCNCDMLSFAHWLNTTETQSQNRIVKDYKQVLLCERKVEWHSSLQSKSCANGILPNDFGRVSM